ncbi:MAG: hypothetical protein BYD32DRAFT_409614 [Podila humilis]|nr:MAG: hypothetical protein BYD32DRAFT_409614 [Podila humilis]
MFVTITSRHLLFVLVSHPCRLLCGSMVLPKELCHYTILSLSVLFCPQLFFAVQKIDVSMCTKVFLFTKVNSYVLALSLVTLTVCLGVSLFHGLLSTAIVQLTP